MPRAEAVVVAEGRIVFVGSLSDVNMIEDRQACTIVEVPPEGVLLPGFHDSHAHPHGGGLQLLGCDLHSCHSLEEALTKVRALHVELPDGQWLVGGGWMTLWFPNRLPTAELLEQVAPGRPVFLRDADGHEAWVSSAAMEIAGISDNMGELDERGLVKRDSEGRAIGYFMEDAANFVKKNIPSAPREMKLKALTLAMRAANECGITAISDAAVQKNSIDTYLAADSQGLLTCRVLGSLLWNPKESYEDNMAWFQEARQAASQCRMFRATSGKLMVDGILENCTAHMHKPYSSSSRGCGFSNFSPQALAEATTGLHNAGFQVHAHAIGDAACTRVLDTLLPLLADTPRPEQAADAPPRSDKGPSEVPSEAPSEKGSAWECDWQNRNIIAHLQCVHPADHPRLCLRGIVCNFSPLWLQRDEEMEEVVEPLLGERSGEQYPVRSLFNGGAALCFGSDWPVTGLSPVQGIAVAATHEPPTSCHVVDPVCPCCCGPARTGAEARSEPAKPTSFLPDQVIPLETGLRIYTAGSAYAMGLDRLTGTLETGKLADLVIVDTDISVAAACRVAEARVLSTWVGGQCVWSVP